jgi:hypothetical protein
MVDRDRTPEVPKRYRVSAYPTILTLNPKDEMIQRWSGGKKTPEEVLALFEDAKRRWALWREGKDWTAPDPRPEKICDDGTLTTIPAPAEDVPCGISAFGDDLFVVQGGRARRIDRKTGKTKGSFEVPESVIDVTTDGKLLFALESGWTAGKPVHVLDPETGKVLRSVVTEANRANRSHGAKGIAWRDGRLWVLSGMSGVLSEVDPEDGRIVRTLKTGKTWLAGLAWDGKRFLLGSREHLYGFDPVSKKVSLEVRVNYRLRSVEAADGAVLLMEQPIFGFDRSHQRIRVWPKKTRIHRLVLGE